MYFARALKTVKFSETRRLFEVGILMKYCPINQVEEFRADRLRAHARVSGRYALRYLEMKRHRSAKESALRCAVWGSLRSLWVALRAPFGRGALRPSAAHVARCGLAPPCPSLAETVASRRSPIAPLPPVGAAARSNKIGVLYGRCAARGDCARGVRYCALRPRAAACDHKPRSLVFGSASARSGVQNDDFVWSLAFFAPPASKVAGFAPALRVQSYPPALAGALPPRGLRPSDRVSCAVSQQDAHSRPDLRKASCKLGKLCSKLDQLPPAPLDLRGEHRCFLHKKGSPARCEAP